MHPHLCQSQGVAVPETVLYKEMGHEAYVPPHAAHRRPCPSRARSSTRSTRSTRSILTFTTTTVHQNEHVLRPTATPVQPLLSSARSMLAMRVVRHGCAC